MKQKPRRRTRLRPMDLRSQTQRQVIARLMLLGCTGERIARRLGCTARAVRYAISTPEFEQLFNQLQAERLKILDRNMNGCSTPRQRRYAASSNIATGVWFTTAVAQDVAGSGTDELQYPSEHHWTNRPEPSPNMSAIPRQSDSVRTYLVRRT